MALTERRKGLYALLLVTLIWGWTFIWMKEALNAVRSGLGPGHATLTVGLFIFLRFGIAAFLLPMFMKEARSVSKSRGAWTRGSIIGLAFFGGFFFQLIGLGEVNPAVSAFLTSLYVVFTALLSTLLERKLPRLFLILGVVLATFGAGSISGPPNLDMSLGEILTIAAAFIFGVQIILTDRLTRKSNPIAMTQASFVCVALLGLVTVIWGWCSEPGFESATMIDVLRGRDFFVPVLLSAILGNVVALTLMMRYQKTLSPVRAAIIYGLEPVWAALFSIWLGFSQASPWLFIGGGALLFGNVIAELKPFSRKNSRPS